jgi:hypothetical protein
MSSEENKHWKNRKWVEGLESIGLLACYHKPGILCSNRLLFAQHDS